MNQRLFHDSGGTTPAIIAGQPVGLIKRLAGSVDALQATALSKPTLARYPMLGKRMLQNRNIFDSVPIGEQITSNYVNGFGTSATSDGITFSVLERGWEGGEPYLVFNVMGTNTLGSTKFMNIQNNDVAVGSDPINISVKAAILAGALGGSDSVANLKAFASFRRAGVSVNGSASILVLSSTEAPFSVVSTATDGLPTDAVASRGLYIRIPAGLSVDATVKIKALQVNLGTQKAEFQTVYDPNDVRQTGVPDLWHLYNDGGDSLNVTLPAGTYGLASIDINRAITITTITSDGTTPINTLRHERQLDVILRAGAFSAGEETAIRDYWGRVFA